MTLPLSINESDGPSSYVLTLWFTSDAVKDVYFKDAASGRPVKIEIVPTSAELYGRSNDPHSFLLIAPNQSVKVHAPSRVQLQPGTYVSYLLLWILSTSPRNDAPAPQGAWRQSDVKWNKPPAELQLEERHAEAALLYFGSNHEFSVVYATVIQGPKSEGVSRGDGQVVFLGKWKSDGAKLSVEYRLVSRTVRKEGEVIPGPLEQMEISKQGDLLLFQKMRFTRDKQLDNDLRAIYQGESARFPK